MMIERLSFLKRLFPERDGFGGLNFVMPFIVSVAVFWLTLYDDVLYLAIPLILPAASLLLAFKWDIYTGKYLALQIGCALSGALAEFVFSELHGLLLLFDFDGPAEAIVMILLPAVFNTAVYRKFSGSWKTTAVLMLTDPGLHWALFWLIHGLYFYTLI